NYNAAAEKVGARAIVPAKMVELLGSATPNDAQLQSFISGKVSRLWRRPVTAQESSTLKNLYNLGLADGPARGFELMIDAALQWPSFLYRTEMGTSISPAAAPFQLTPYELATALSFSFTESTPDDTLWLKAQNGTVTSPDVLAGEVDRLMALASVQL